MRRTWIRRSAKPIARRTPLNRRNAKRCAKRFAENYGVRGDAIRGMACLLAHRQHGDGKPECEGDIEAAHAKSRGAGGNRRDLVPLCRGHHALSHRIGSKTFDKRMQISLRDAADRIAVTLDELGLP